MMLMNDLNNLMAIQGGFAVALNTVFTSEIISEDSIYSKALKLKLNLSCLMSDLVTELKEYFIWLDNLNQKRLIKSSPLRFLIIMFVSGTESKY